MGGSKKAAKRDKDPDDQIINVGLSRRDWRAATALYYSALSITEEPVHRMILTRIYKEIESQTRMIPTPVLVEQGDDS